MIIAVFPMIANTLFGLQSASAAAHDLFTLNKATRWQRLLKLQFPAAVPSIFTGLRNAAGLSVIGAIVGDFFFQQGAPGIGGLLRVYTQRLQMEALLTCRHAHRALRRRRVHRLRRARPRRRRPLVRPSR